MDDSKFNDLCHNKVSWNSICLLYTSTEHYMLVLFTHRITTLAFGSANIVGNVSGFRDDDAAESDAL